MPKYLIGYTYQYNGEARFGRRVHEQDGELTEEDLADLEKEIAADPRSGVPAHSRAVVVAVSELAPDRPKAAKEAGGCFSLVLAAPLVGLLLWAVR